MAVSMSSALAKNVLFMLDFAAESTRCS